VLGGVSMAHSGGAAAVRCAWFAAFLARVGDEPRAVDLLLDGLD
jgi:hypothetical protein